MLQERDPIVRDDPLRLMLSVTRSSWALVTQRRTAFRSWRLSRKALTDGEDDDPDNTLFWSCKAYCSIEPPSH